MTHIFPRNDHYMLKLFDRSLCLLSYRAQSKPLDDDGELCQECVVAARRITIPAHRTKK